MSSETSGRWSDQKLTEFHDEFQVLARKFAEHMEDEEDERKAQKEIYDALFRKEDKELGLPPGVLQLMTQVNERLKAMEDKQKSQKSFVGGIVFAVSAMWFFLTDGGHKISALLHKIFS